MAFLAAVSPGSQYSTTYKNPTLRLESPGDSTTYRFTPSLPKTRYSVDVDIAEIAEIAPNIHTMMYMALRILRMHPVT